MKKIPWIGSQDFIMTLTMLFFLYCTSFMYGFFFGIISIMYVIGCIRLEGGVLDSYYISCNARPFGQPTGEQAHNTHHQSST